MTLARYHAKRDFKITSEPRGGDSASGTSLSFVIQRHAASHLHYDFRLELDGVLKSWAVPKGPSLDPADKRLAVHVEDHPLEYGTFEGTIPPEQYGAGEVVLWDRGVWVPDVDPHEGYRKGNLKFHLDGHKLQGGWALVRMGKPSDTKENWLLIKERDDMAKAGASADITTLRPESVASSTSTTSKKAKKRTATQFAGGVDTKVSPAGESDTEASSLDPEGAEPRALMRKISPQLATLSDRSPSGTEWVAEIKYDGYRALCRIDQGKVNLFTRNGNDWTSKWPDIASCAAALDVDQAWLDGEVVAIGDDGKTNFQALQKNDREGGNQRLAFYVFDLLYLNGFDLMGMKLVERKRLLAEVVNSSPASGPILYSDHLQGNAQAVFEHACLHGLEGIVAKRADGHYLQQRTRDWLKIKCAHRQEFVIGGYTDPDGAREHFGALLLGVYDGSTLRYAGRVGTGFDARKLASLSGKFQSLRRDTSPFATPPTGVAARGVHWLAPTLVAEVQFAEWTDSGAVRHASFVALRDDKQSAQVRRETPHALAENRDVGSSEDTVAGVSLTHPSRILFADSGVTKFGLARYYEKVAYWLLPHLRNRPLSLVRCPHVGGKCFFQKHVTETTSQLIDRVEVGEGSGEATYMMANSLEAVISMVQIGVLELHTWGASAGRLDFPDRLIMDLDPAPELPWQQVTEAALLLRGLFDEVGLRSYVKTTGGKGLHVVVPIRPEYRWDRIKAFTKGVAEHLALTMPDRFTANMSKAVRRDKIFIDYLRNTSGATAVSAYSTRAHPGAPISVPIFWDEVGDAVRADSFHVTDLQARLDTLSADPWEGYFELDQRLSKRALDLFSS